MEVEIKPHPEHPNTHQIVIVTTNKGLVYACTYGDSDEELTVEVAKRDWRRERRAFRPYNTSNGRYC